MKTRSLWLLMFTANVLFLGFFVFALVAQTVIGDPVRGVFSSGAGLLILSYTAVLLWRDRRSYPRA